MPEVQGKLDWSKNAEGGFVYKRPADNNPDVMGGLTLYGEDLVETLFTKISPNSTINITNDTVVIKTDGNGDFAGVIKSEMEAR